MDRPKIVTLCGSTRFSQAFQHANLTETLAGNIVLTIGCDMRSDEEIFAGKSAEELADIKLRLDVLHLHKVDLADEVLILNVDGYIGQSTARELDHAITRGKKIRFLEPDKAPCLPCRGKGWTSEDSGYATYTCEACNGTGFRQSVA